MSGIENDRNIEFLKKSSYVQIENTYFADPFNELLGAALQNFPVILYGPPGTGKTRLISLLIERLRADQCLGKYELVQFHRKFSYEDFIEGYVPTEIGFSRRDGIFKEFCSTPSAGGLQDVFIIDEINRTDLASTFGEVLYALEDRSTRTVKTAHFGDEFNIPVNLLLIGTMNTADKSIANIDFAVRRRFRFIPVFPDKFELLTWISEFDWQVEEFSISDYIRFFERTNLRISGSKQLGSHMQLGQSLFVPTQGGGAITIEEITRNFRDFILTQVEAYLGFGNLQGLATIFNGLVAEEFISRRQVNSSAFSALVNESVTDKSE